MKIVIIGGTGLIGSKTVAILRQGGHEVTAASPNSGVNTGCTPTKTLVASAYAAHTARRAADYGVILDAPPRVDMARVKARADAIVARSRSGVESWLRGTERCTVITGHARFLAPDMVEVGEERLSAPRIFINVGGRALVPNLPGIGEVPFLTNVTSRSMRA